MKWLALILAGLFSSVAFAATPTNGASNGGTHSQTAVPEPAGKIVWQTNFAQAASIAQRENKPLFLFFTGSDWCGWCKKLESEVLDTPQFAKDMGSDFVFVKIDFPMKNPLPEAQTQENTQLKHKYGISGFPTIVLLKPNQSFIAETGYRPGGAAAFAQHIRSLM